MRTQGISLIAAILLLSESSSHAFRAPKKWQENAFNQFDQSSEFDNHQIAQQTNKPILDAPLSEQPAKPAKPAKPDKSANTSNSIKSGTATSTKLNSNSDSDNGPQTVTSVNNSNKKMWNLDDVDLLALIGEMSRITGRNFIIDSRVTGKASLISNKPMDDEEAYQAFLSILQVQGFAVIDSGSVTKIVPDSIAKQIDSKVNSSNLKGLGEEMVVQVIAVKNVSATALLPILRGLVNQQVAHLAAYAPSNVIVVADHAANVARMIEIINRIDKQSTDDVEIISLKDASSDEIVKVLTNLISTQQMGDLGGQQIKMAADLRTNSVLLSGDKAKRMKLRALIAQMDVPTPRTGDTEVIRLNYQTANALVPVVASIVEAYYSRNTQSNSSDGNLARNMRSSDPSMAGGYRQSGINNASTMSNPNSQNNTLASTLQLPDARREDGLSAPGVRSEPNTNALVVTAPPELMKNIKAVIAELDVRRFQVLVEALIVEVTMEHTQDLGVEWRLGGEVRGGTNFPVGGSTNGLYNSYASSTTGGVTSLLENSALGRLLPTAGMTVGFVRGHDLRAVLSALQKDSNTNIVSTPSLVAMDNETAEIVVADKIPYQTAAAQSTLTNTSQLTSSFDYRDVGLSLKITPMITKGDAVKLTIEQHTGSVKTPGDRPTTSERSVKTAVVVNNKDILVLGGLIQGQQDAGESKVPILGDIPIIGNLFKRTASNLNKKNLMVFIRPVVISNSDESNNISLSKYDYTRDGQLLYKLDPYGKIAKELIMELPDMDHKNQKNKNRLALPGPFDGDSSAGLVIDLTNR